MMEILKSLLERKKSTRRDNRGMSLVETLCAVVILALVSVTIGSVIVYSTRAYGKGVSETNVQQEAQLAANNIGNLIKDAYGVQYEDSTLTLTIVTNDNVQYLIQHVPLTRKLLYEEIDSAGSLVGDQQVIANSVKDFNADTSEFDNTRTVKLTMTVVDESTGREIPMEYTMKSRNEKVDGDLQFFTVSDSVKIYPDETDFVMVPGETYRVKLSIVGAVALGLETDSANTTSGVSVGLPGVSEVLDYVDITIPRNYTGDTAQVTIQTQDKKEGTLEPKATATIKVRVRRVKTINVSHAVDSSGIAESENIGNLESKGAKYTFYADAQGSNFAKDPGTSNDSAWRNPKAVYWSYELKVDGNTYECKYDIAAGELKYSNKSAAEQYIKVLSFSNPDADDVDRPTMVIELEQNMSSDFVLTVTATARHAFGVNKAGSPYPNDSTTDYTGKPNGSDTIKPRSTKVSGTEITLEPNETGAADLKMVGGGATSATCVLRDNSDSTTSAYFVTDKSDPDYRKIKITIGNDEHGQALTSGTVPYNYTFYVDVYLDGSATVSATVTVHVSRIDTLSIYRDDGNFAGNLPTYDFRARINEKEGNVTIDPSATQYLIEDTDVIQNTLASKITWELIDCTGGENYKIKYHTKDEDGNDEAVIDGAFGTEICMADKQTATTKFSSSYLKQYKTDYYKIEHIKPARIESSDGGVTWTLKQMPEIDITPTYEGSNTGLPQNTKLKVTIEMLHPSNSYNKGGKDYSNTIKASAYLEGDMTVEAEGGNQVIVVEPGQGTNDPGQSDYEMVIPIRVHGGDALKLEARFTTSPSDSATKLSDYSSFATKDPSDPSKTIPGTNPYYGYREDSTKDTIWYLGLIIGKDEKGEKKDSDYTGLIGLEVTAKGKNDKVLGTADLTLAVRRVNEVEVSALKIETGGSYQEVSIADVNVSGNTFALEADPIGFEPTGELLAKLSEKEKTKNDDYKPYFYQTQKKENGETCRWETTNHGEYKDPCTMRWTMEYKGVEKPLEDWTEYIAKVGSDKIVLNEKGCKQTIEVTLQSGKNLPNGAVLRAYSLHAQGVEQDKNGNVVEGGEKYNKSGKEYGVVYGELMIGDGLIDSGFLRGTSNFLCSFPSQRQSYDNAGSGVKQRTFFRFREINGAWTAYHITEEQSETEAWLRLKESLLFDADKEYELEVISVVFSEQDKKIFWPQDISLLESGKGWTEDGYTQGWTGSNNTEESEYLKRFYIGKTQVSFQENTDWGVLAGSRLFGSYNETNPVPLKRDIVLKAGLQTKYFSLGDKQNYFKAKIWKLENGVWKDSTNSNWNLQTSCPTFQIDNIQDSASGTYRIGIVIENMSWKTLSGTLMNPQYTDITRTTELYNLNDGTGILYVSFNE